MAKPLLYAFGGLPVALLAVLLLLGHQPPVVEEPVTTETLTPATPLTPETATGPVSIPAEVKAPPERVATAPDATQPDAVKDVSPPKPLSEVVTEDIIKTLPPEIIAPPRVQVDGSDETAEMAPAPVKPRDVPEMKIAATEPPPAVPPVSEASPIFGNERVEIAAQDPVTKPEQTTGRVIVQPGNTLWRLSRVIYGKGRDYMTIAEANRDIVRDPALIFPGQVIAIPGATPPEKIDPKRKRPLPPVDGSLSLAR